LKGNIIFGSHQIALDLLKESLKGKELKKAQERRDERETGQPYVFF